MVDEAGKVWSHSPPTSQRDRVMGSHTEICRDVGLVDYRM